MTRRSNSRPAAKSPVTEYDKGISNLQGYIRAVTRDPNAEEPLNLLGMGVAHMLLDTLKGLRDQSVPPREQLVGWAAARIRHRLKPVSRLAHLAGTVEGDDTLSRVRILTDGTVAVSTEYRADAAARRAESGLDTDPVLSIMGPDDLAWQLTFPEGSSLAKGVVDVLTKVRNRTLPSPEEPAAEQRLAA